MAGKKTSAKTIYIFVVSSIVLILGVAYLFRPPPRAARTAAPATEHKP
jgi:hypothetical protein